MWNRAAWALLSCSKTNGHDPRRKKTTINLHRLSKYWELNGQEERSGGMGLLRSQVRRRRYRWNRVFATGRSRSTARIRPLCWLQLDVLCRWRLSGRWVRQCGNSESTEGNWRRLLPARAEGPAAAADHSIHWNSRRCWTNWRPHPLSFSAFSSFPANRHNRCHSIYPSSSSYFSSFAFWVRHPTDLPDCWTIVKNGAGRATVS